MNVAGKAADGAFAGTGGDILRQADAEKKTTPQPLDFTPTSEDYRVASKMLYNFSLLSGMTTQPSGFAKDLGESLAAMDPKQLQRAAALMEKENGVSVKRDAMGNVTAMGYTQRRPEIPDSLFGKILIAPDIAIGRTVGALNRGFHDDVEVSLNANRVRVQASQYWNIQEPGKPRSNVLEVPRK